jgi:hypothetical protein
MISVYRILTDPNTYQSLMAEEPADYVHFPWDGTSLIDNWNPFPVYIPQPTLKEPDFFNFAFTTLFAASEDLVKKLSLFFNQSCEALKVYLEDASYYALNVVYILNALDKKRSEFNPLFPQQVVKYQFKKNRFNHSLFRLYETREILCVEGRMAPEEEFKGFVEMNNLTGLKFQKIWSENT